MYTNDFYKAVTTAIIIIKLVRLLPSHIRYLRFIVKIYISADSFFDLAYNILNDWTMSFLLPIGRIKLFGLWIDLWTFP